MSLLRIKLKYAAVQQHGTDGTRIQPKTTLRLSADLSFTMVIQGYAKDFHEMCEIFLWNSLAFIPFVEVFSWAVKNAFTLHKYRVEVFS